MPHLAHSRLRRSTPSRLRRPRATLVAGSAALVSVLAVSIGLSGCGALAVPGLQDGGRTDTVGAVDFVTPLAVPPLAESRIDEEGRRVFALEAREGTSRFRPGSDTTTSGYNGAYLGPTLVAGRGETVGVDVTNALAEDTTVHWHGMHLPPEMDGGPHQPIRPGGTWSPTWTIDQPAATLWYHPHLHGDTEGQVARGLAGLFLIQDPVEAALPLPRNYGVDDVPVVVQDVRLGGDGERTTDGRGFVGMLGDQLLVNGTIAPYLDVTAAAVRLRLVNASTARVYDFGFADRRPFAVVATDGGLLERPHPTTSVQLSPGERAEVVVDMVPGERIVLRSTPPDLGVEDVLAARNGGADRFDVLELRAAATLTPWAGLPDRLADLPDVRVPVAAEREFRLNGYTINSEPMSMDRIDETVAVDTTEVWTVRNEMELPHNFHVHDVQFRVLSVGGAAPPPELAGWKDTVYLPPDLEFRLQLTFADYANDHTPYMYHCHLLSHEDRGMMGQFLVTEDGRPRSPEDSRGHHGSHGG